MIRVSPEQEAALDRLSILKGGTAPASLIAEAVHSYLLQLDRIYREHVAEQLNRAGGSTEDLRLQSELLDSRINEEPATDL
tara:strand:+ start:4696 stop:4938 length:243 start_codon:yes stop_codon:yes gene_type:complete